MRYQVTTTSPFRSVEGTRSHMLRRIERATTTCGQDGKGLIVLHLKLTTLSRKPAPGCAEAVMCFHAYSFPPKMRC